MTKDFQDDCIKEIIDANKEEIPLITFSDQNVALVKLQINIQSSFPQPEFKYQTYSTPRLIKPTPCQYAIIADKAISLKSFINFMCNKKEDYHIFASPEYERGLKLDLEPVFFPTCSSTSLPLLHLCVGLGRIECLKVLIDFLNEQGKLKEIMNRPNRHLMTPLTIGFATGIEELILLLLENGADPYCEMYEKSNEDNENNSDSKSQKIIMPIIYTIKNYPQLSVNNFNIISKYHENDESFNPFAPLDKLFFDDIGFSYKTQENNSQKFTDFIRKVPDVHTMYCDNIKRLEKIKTLEDEKRKEKDNDDNEEEEQTSKTQAKTCPHPECSSQATTLCPRCRKRYCSDHVNDHECAK